MCQSWLECHHWMRSNKQSWKLTYRRRSTEMKNTERTSQGDEASNLSAGVANKSSLTLRFNKSHGPPSPEFLSCHPPKVGK
eukprot:4194423-Amphidinium_carterae.1